MRRLHKRSLVLAGHATSVALEPEFWAALEAMADGAGVSIATLLAGLDAGRAGAPLASVARVAALTAARAGKLDARSQVLSSDDRPASLIGDD